MYSFHLFLISSASVRSLLFLSFTVPLFVRNVPLLSLIFLERSLVLPVVLFSSISLHYLLKMTFLSLLAILWNSTFSWVYFYFSLLPFASLLFWDICKVSSDNHITFFNFFSLGWFWSLLSVQCYEPLSRVSKFRKSWYSVWWWCYCLSCADSLWLHGL